MATWQDEKVYDSGISATVSYRLEFGGLLGDFINSACTVVSGKTGNCLFKMDYTGDNKMMIPLLASPEVIQIDDDNEDEYLTPYWKNESTGTITNLPTSKREFFLGRVQKNGVWYQQLLTYTVLHPENCTYNKNANPSSITFNGVRHTFGNPVEGTGDFSSPTDLKIQPNFGSQILLNRDKITAEGVNTNTYYSISKNNLRCRLTTKEIINIDGTIYSGDALFYVDVILNEDLTFPAKVWDPKTLFIASATDPTYDRYSYTKKIGIHYSTPGFSSSIPFYLGVFTNYLWTSSSYIYRQQMKRENSYEHYYSPLSTTTRTVYDIDVTFPGYMDSLAYIDGDTSEYPVLVDIVYDSTATNEKAILVYDVREIGTNDTLFHTIIKDNITVSTWDYNYTYDFSSASLVATTEGTYQDKYSSLLFDSGKSTFDLTYVVNRIPLYKGVTGYNSYGRTKVISYKIIFNSYLKTVENEIVYNFPVFNWTPDPALISDNFVTNLSFPWDDQTFSSTVPADSETINAYGGLKTQIIRDSQVLSEKELISEKKVTNNNYHIYHWAPVELVSAQTERYKLSSGSYVRDDTSGTYLGTKVDYTLHSIDGTNMIRVHKVTYSLEDDTQAVSYDFADNVYNYHSPFDIEQSWKVVVELSDDLQQTIRYVYTVAAGRTFLDFLAGGTGMAIGKICEDPGLEIALDTKFGHDPAAPVTVDFTNSNVVGLSIGPSGSVISGTDGTGLLNYTIFGNKMPGGYVELKGTMDFNINNTSATYAVTGTIDFTGFLGYDNFFNNFTNNCILIGGTVISDYRNTAAIIKSFYFYKDSANANEASFRVYFQGLNSEHYASNAEVTFDVLLPPATT